MRMLVSLIAISVGLLLYQNAHGDEPTLTVEQARQRVAQLKPADEMNLNELTSLAPQVAEEVVRHKGAILLGGLKQISPETAEWLASHEGYTRLSGLEKPSKHVLGILGKHRGVLHLHLPNLLEVNYWPNPRQAKYGSVRDEHSLSELTRASTSTLHITGGHRIFPRGLSDGGVWRALAKKRIGRLVFWGWSNAQDDPRPLPPDLMETTAVLEFPDLQRISVEDAKALIKHNGQESHLGIQTLDAPVAKILAGYPGLLVLPRMTAITALAAAELKHANALIHFPNLKTATDETRALLRENPRVESPELD